MRSNTKWDEVFRLFDKEELTWKDNVESLLEHSINEFERAIKEYKEMCITFKKTKADRKLSKINAIKFKNTFPEMELPNTFFSNEAKRRYYIIYMRKSKQLIKKFKKAIQENKKTLKAFKLKQS